MYYEEWDRRYHAQATHEDDQLLMFGLLFSLREMTRQLSPQPVDSFSSFKTDVQKVHYFQTGTGLRFVLCTAPSVGDMTKHLLHIYKNIFVEYVAKNPLYSYQVVEPRRKGPPHESGPLVFRASACRHAAFACARLLKQAGRAQHNMSAMISGDSRDDRLRRLQNTTR